MHWDGSQWSIVPSPNPSGSGYNPIYGVVAISQGDAWAVGHSYLNGKFQTLTMHWNGAQWSLVASPNPGGPGQDNVLRGVTANTGSPPEGTPYVWAVGYYAGSDPNYSTLGKYDPAKTKDTGDVATNANDGLTSNGKPLHAIDVGDSDIKGHAATGPAGTVYVTSNGSVGDLAWVNAGTAGIKPGWSANE